MILELRDHFAAAVLPGLVDSYWAQGEFSAKGLGKCQVTDLLPMAKLAYRVADSMLEARDESETPD